MILPDVNVLIYAFRADVPQHERCAEWLEGVVSRGDGLALCDAVLAGFLRVATHSKVISPPTPTERALDFVSWLIESPGAHWLNPSPSVWEVFGRIVADDRGVCGNLVPGAYLAALAIAHGRRSRQPIVASRVSRGCDESTRLSEGHRRRTP